VRALALAAAVVLGGCAMFNPPKEEVRLTRSILTSAEPTDRIARQDRTHFRVRDQISLVTTVNWTNPLIDGGHREITWKWYAGDSLHVTAHQAMDLIGNPYEIIGGLPASALGAGEHKVECLVDEKLIDSRTFIVEP
jgi:hypothetical protein